MLSVRSLLVSSAVISLSACGSGEQELLDTFFTAVQTGDESTVEAVSLVGFSGEVKAWEIVAISPESSEPFLLPELRRKTAAAKTELDSQLQKDTEFLEFNNGAYERYQAEREKNPEQQHLEGELGDFQQEWEKRQEDQKVLQSKLDDANQKVKHERRAAGMSLRVSVGDSYDGDVTIKELRVKVDAGTGEKTYTIEFRKYDLADQERKITPISTWIIADIREQGN